MAQVSSFRSFFICVVSKRVRYSKRSDCLIMGTMLRRSSFRRAACFALAAFSFSSWSFCSASRWSSGAFAVPLSSSPGTLPLLLHPSPLAHVSTPCRGASVLRFLSFVPLALTPWPSGLSFQRSLQPLTVGSWSSSVAYSPSWKAAEWWTVSLPVR